MCQLSLRGLAVMMAATLFFVSSALAQLGACCMPDGTCQETLPVECTAGGMHFAGLPCGPEGACCLPDGTCLENTTQLCCEVLGGCYVGEATQCPSDGMCSLFGACCLPNGSCVQRSLECCKQAGGCFQGDGSDCIDAECTGACCFIDGTCAQLSADQCGAAGGEFRGFDTSCDRVICAATGACCFGSGPDLCMDDMTFQQCTSAGGQYMGFDSECATTVCTGACCDALTGECTPNQTRAQCEADGGVFQGTGSDCASATDCWCEVHIRQVEGPQNDILGPIGTANVPKFSEQDGDRVLQSVEIVVEGRVVLMLVTCNSAANDETLPSFRTIEQTVLAALPDLMPPPIPLEIVDETREIDLAPFFIQPGCCYDYSNPILSPELMPGMGVHVPSMMMLNQFIDMPPGGTTFPVRIDGRAVVDFPCAKCDDLRRPHRVQTTITVTYCFAPTGACCLDDGSCVPQLTEDECVTNQNGTWLGPFSDCSPNVGGCCLPDGSCMVMNESCCLTVGGFFAGDGTTCDIGACCLGASCQQVTEACCRRDGGTFVGGPCSPTGGCCLPDGSCIITTVECCNNAGGFYAGDGTSCDIGACCIGPNCQQESQACCLRDGGTFIGGPCAPLGACCLTDGSCVITTQECCENDDGFYAGDETSCDVGACCLPSGLCVQRNEACCVRDGGTFSGGPCDPVGGCCLPDGSCIVTTPFCCANEGGFYAGDGTTCDVGACCLDGGCTQETEACCLENGGTFVGGACGLLGGCCLPDGSCVLTIEQCCTLEGGFFAGAGSSCDDGACCLPSGECVQAIEACCVDPSGLNGTFIGGPCDPTGGCCLPDGSCIITTQVCCESANGFYAGDGTTCDIGACCLLTGECIQASEACCEDPSQFNGTFIGGPCDPTGGCCLPDGSCIITTEFCCTGAGGFYAGDGSTCDLGACCLPSGDCIQETEACCIDPNGFDGTFIGGPCDPTGGCCLPDGSCIITTQVCCDGVNGFYAGDGSTCDSGACCLDDGCSQQTEACCLRDGGTFVGGACVPVGGCCLPDGSCILTTEQCCVLEGGFFAGAGSTCDEGACCLPNGECIQETEACCVDPNGLGGTFIGGACAPTGGCCLPDGSCIVTTQTCCEGAGGFYAGDGTGCATGACCLAIDDCVETTEACCLRDGGQFVPGLPCGAQTGACCMNDGADCVQSFGPCCEIMGGVFAGEGISCGVQGTCCLGDQCVTDIWQACCVDFRGPGVPCNPNPCVPTFGGCDEKGSLVIFSKVEIRWDSAGNLLQDTFLQLSNDYPQDVTIKFYFINGDPPLAADPGSGERAHPGWNWLNNRITLTNDQPTYWSALTGLGGSGPDDPTFSPFTVLDPGFPPGRPDPEVPGERMLRGFIVAWAVDIVSGVEIRWNHLSGIGTLVHYRDGYAWEYRACGFPVIVGVGGQPAHGQPTGQHPGELHLDDVEYRAAAAEQLMNFQAVGSTAFSGPVQILSDTDLTLHPLDIDLRQETTGPVTTKAEFTIANMNEARFSTHLCVTCWTQTMLSNFPPVNQFLLMALQTDHGKTRINGVASALCDLDLDGDFIPDVISQPAAMSGLTARLLRVDGGAAWSADGTNLFDLGAESAVIRYDLGSGPPENEDPPRTKEQIEAFIRNIMEGGN